MAIEREAVGSAADDMAFGLAFGRDAAERATAQFDAPDIAGTIHQRAFRKQQAVREHGVAAVFDRAVVAFI